MADDESGQMMLLAAVVLLIAFMSLTVMVGRVGTVASETARQGELGFLREAEIVEKILDNSTVESNKVTSFPNLRSLEASRGYALTCERVTGDPDDLDNIRLSDGVSVATFTGFDFC